MKTIVLDDDPTGTQFASNVRVLLDWDTESIYQALIEADVVYVQTNSRSINETDAIDLAQKIKGQALLASKMLGEEINFILRGDSTLRGHVFAETEVFMDESSVMIFVPGYPDIGRTTLNGIHFVKIEGVNTPADATEFAQDPIFPFSTSVLADYVASKSDRIGHPISLDLVRSGTKKLVEAFEKVPSGHVILPDVETNEDLRTIAAAVNIFRSQGRSIAVRCAAPLAAMMTGVDSKKLLEGPIMQKPFSALLAAGSHTGGASAQLSQVIDRYGSAEIIKTFLAMTDAFTCGSTVAEKLIDTLKVNHFAIVMTERERLPEHNTLAHGEKVMEALVEAVKKTVSSVEVVITKGGITSADIAKRGIGAISGWVLGQILPGISLWRVEDRSGRSLLYVVVPGNVGNADTLINVLDILGLNS